MRVENIKDLESLSLFCHISGTVTIFLGVLVIVMDVINQDFRHIQVGFFIFITGYTFVKISDKITSVVSTEKNEY